jgi:hypothetical protein
MSTTSEIVELLHEAIESGMSVCYDDTFAAAAIRLAELERENARMLGVLKQISGTSSKLCPFTRGVPNSLQPDDPCPVCGDKGDFSDETTNSPSRCVGNAPSAIARAALAGSGEK